MAAVDVKWKVKLFYACQWYNLKWSSLFLFLYVFSVDWLNVFTWPEMLDFDWTTHIYCKCSPDGVLAPTSTHFMLVVAAAVRTRNRNRTIISLLRQWRHLPFAHRTHTHTSNKLHDLLHTHTHTYARAHASTNIVNMANMVQIPRTMKAIKENINKYCENIDLHLI